MAERFRGGGDLTLTCFIISAAFSALLIAAMAEADPSPSATSRICLVTYIASHWTPPLWNAKSLADASTEAMELRPSSARLADVGVENCDSVKAESSSATNLEAMGRRNSSGYQKSRSRGARFYSPRNMCLEASTSAMPESLMRPSPSLVPLPAGSARPHLRR